MKVYPVLATSLFLFHSVVCGIRKTKLTNDTAWPILYYVEGGINMASGLDGLYRFLADEDLTPHARSVIRYDATSEEFKTLSFYSKLSKTSNCRASFDKWDCEGCKDLLPDGVVVRSFSTFPLGITGNIVVSDTAKTIFIQIQGASSIRNKLTFREAGLVPHPSIPGANVQRGLLQAMTDIRDILHNTVTDQLLLHPDYAVHVTGHSFGGGVGSLIVVDLYQAFPQLNSTNLVGYLMGKPRVGDFAYAKYVGDEKIQIRRLTQQADDIVHRPDIRDGFVHEGDEYWIRSEETPDALFCPGPYETRNCSNSMKYVTIFDHLMSFGTFQGCKDLLYNLL